MNFEEKIKNLRNERNENQDQASKGIGIAISSLRNYENGRLPDTYQLKKIKEYYNVSYEYLLDNNCENKTTENIEIGKFLSLSDKSIQAIMNSKEYSNILNFILENINLNNFLDNFKLYYIINDLIEDSMLKLMGIYNFREYIISKLSNNKTEDILGFFNECDKIIFDLHNYFLSIDNPYSDDSSINKFNSLEKEYNNLKDILFKQKDKSTKIKIRNFKSSIEQFINSYEDLLYKMIQYRKIAYLDISEYMHDFIKNMGNTDFNNFKELLKLYKKHTTYLDENI